ncbi:methyltransferase domain-containing protein [Roseinatronobacter sp. NSM]|uniref:methyltransferase domain-containing protein n=1 Tax=Roseinatronobacter sp. NSM TaxID=3457785 RepID=UPI004035595E
MTQTPPELTDRAALRRNRQRVGTENQMPFLHATAQEELQFRLSMVNRSFNAPAIVTGLPQYWQDFLPHARVVADDAVLDLQEGAHDLVLHVMALHWASDPVGQLVQARRALRPDGLFLGVLFGGQTLSELRSALAQAESDLTGGLSPRIVPMAEIRDLGALLQRAGLALPVADSLTVPVAYGKLQRLFDDLRAMGERNALAGRRRGFTRPALFRRTARNYAAHYADSAGRLMATYELIFLTGWAPDASQPRPLRPGSAKMSLADALGSVETALPDQVKIPGTD